MWVSAIACAYGGFQGWRLIVVPLAVVAALAFTLLLWAAGGNTPTPQGLAIGAGITSLVDVVAFALGRLARKMTRKATFLAE